MKKVLIFCVSLLFSIFFAKANISLFVDDTTDVLAIQEEDTVVLKKAYYVFDTTTLVKKSFNEEALKKYRQDERFQYENGEVKENNTGLSWWHKLIYKILEWIGKFLGGFYKTFTNENGEFTWIFYGSIILLSAALSYFLYRVLQGKLIRRGSGKDIKNEYQTIIEDIHEMDFDALLSEAIQKQMYRRAVRILFLKSLKELTDKKIILWEENKTNQDYFYEIKSRKIQTSFDTISNVFDYVWYGEVELNQEKFNQIQVQFSTFSKQIAQNER